MIAVNRNATGRVVIVISFTIGNVTQDVVRAVRYPCCRPIPRSIFGKPWTDPRIAAISIIIVAVDPYSHFSGTSRIRAIPTDPHSVTRNNRHIARWRCYINCW